MSDATTLTTLSSALGRLAAQAAPSLVSLRTHRAALSGFAWKPDLVITAEEALAEQEEASVTLLGGETVGARVIGRDSSTDVALLRLERGALAPLTLGDAAAETGALVLVMGAEDGGATAALGVVSRAAGAWHSLRGGTIDARIELDVRLRRGAEGAAVMDAAGRLLGMAVSGPRRRTLVIPSATIARVAVALERDGRVPRGYFGLGLQPVTVGDSRRAGAMVMNLDPQGPGAKAGLVQGDIVLACDGTNVGNIRALLRTLGADSVGRVVTLTISRGGAVQDVKLTIAERPGA